MTAAAFQAEHHFQVVYRSLFHEGRGMAFPSDADGRVDVEALNESARRSYAQTRNRVGRDFAAPQVQPCGLC